MIFLNNKLAERTFQQRILLLSCLCYYTKTMNQQNANHGKLIKYEDIRNLNVMATVLLM